MGANKLFQDQEIIFEEEEPDEIEKAPGLDSMSMASSTNRIMTPIQTVKVKQPKRGSPDFGSMNIQPLINNALLATIPQQKADEESQPENDQQNSKIVSLDTSAISCNQSEDDYLPIQVKFMGSSYSDSELNDSNSTDFNLEAPRSSLISILQGNIDSNKPAHTIKLMVVDDDNMFLNICEIFIRNYFSEWDDVDYTFEAFSSPSDALEHLKVL